MIAIRNISAEVKAFGVQDYEVRINQDVICTFTHIREEGLTVCLQKAAAAVEQAKWMKVADVLLAVKARRARG